MYKVEPLKRRVWDERKGEVLELPEVYGYCVIDDATGRTIGEGETRSEALERAADRILLPKAHKAGRV